ncbi:alcohol oxidase [Marasmius fiardii PR-910]|nr:alcohol oxidase [Marasmius fiardii PR-910]
MYAENITQKDPRRSEYDIIFAGGGATACVTAGRLAAGDPSLRILIIEAGDHTRELPQHVQPAQFCNNLKFGSNLFWNHVGSKSEALGGRAPVVPSGRCLGGGSSVNFMFYARAPASDYDDWEKLGNPGWSSRELIPLSVKAETFQSILKSESGRHGQKGPIKVSRSGPEESFNVGSQFLDAALAYDPERAFAEDLDDFALCDAYGFFYRYVDAETGRRSDTAHNYIYSQEANNNLQIKVKHRVCRIILENSRAVGVEYTPEESRGTQDHLKAFASRLVVVSAGSFGSPAILQRSGIGSKVLLEKTQVEQVVDLPGVGENYNDHNLLFPPYITTEDMVRLNEIFCGTEDTIQPHLAEWVKSGQGLLATNGLNSGIKLRPNKKDLEALGDSFMPVWEKKFSNNPDKPVLFIGNVAGYTNHLIPGDDRGRKCFQLGYFTEYPLSIGHVYISSGADPFAPLDFNPRYLEHDADLAVLRWGYKRTRELARRMKCFRGEYSPLHPSFPEGSPAVTREVSGPVAISDPDIVYSSQDDKTIDDYHRAFVSTTWHSLGTCAMKPREQEGVVDPRLNVYGVKNLKVADLSIAPLNVGANTYNTAIIIGEKAALIIAEELKAFTEESIPRSGAV